MKSTIKFALFAFITLIFSSCLTEDLSVYSDDAVITVFYLYDSNDESLRTYSFTIDDDEKLIYNADSIDFGTDVDSVMPIFTPTFWRAYINDSIEYSVNDSMHMDFTTNNQFSITVYASNKKKSQTYKAQINIHTVDPDSCLWKDMDAKVFSEVATDERAFYLNDHMLYFATIDGVLYNYISSDAKDWSRNSVTGLPAIVNNDLDNMIVADTTLYYYSDNKLYSSVDGSAWSSAETTGSVDYLLFYLNSKFYGVDNTNGKFVTLNNSEWVAVSSIPNGFPISGAAITVGATVKDNVFRAYVVGGVDKNGNYLSSVWSTENCSYWADLSLGKDYFSPRADAAVVSYADGLMLFGGRDENGVVTTETHLFSNDYGVTWVKPENKMIIDGEYTTRYGHSVISVSETGYLYLIGGRISDDISMADVWRGYRYKSLPDFLD